MNELISNKLKMGQPLTTEETKIFLDHLVFVVRRDTKITDIKDIDCAKCNETSRLVGAFTIFNNCDCDILSFKQIMDIELTHHSNIVSINTVEGIKNFLVDLTYIQFFKDSYILDNLKTMNFKKYIITNEQITLSKNLIEQGYVEFTEDNFKLYIEAFLDAYSEVMNIDKTEAYQKLYDYLNNQKLKFNSLNDNYETSKSIK